MISRALPIMPIIVFCRTNDQPSSCASLLRSSYSYRCVKCYNLCFFFVVVVFFCFFFAAVIRSLYGASLACKNEAIA